MKKSANEKQALASELNTSQQTKHDNPAWNIKFVELRN